MGLIAEALFFLWLLAPLAIESLEGRGTGPRSVLSDPTLLLLFCVYFWNF